MKLFRSLLLLLVAVPLNAADPPAKAPQPHTVKVQGTKLKLSAVLHAVGEQTGIVVQAAEDVGDPEIDVNVLGISFWQALDTIAAKAQARPYFYERDGKIRLVKASKEANPHVSYDGLFRISLRRLTALTDFETGGRGLTASLEIAWEPHLLPLYLDTNPRKFIVHDGKGNTLPTKERGEDLVPADNRLAMQIDNLALPLAPRGDTKLALLQGELRVRAPSKMLTFTLGNLNDVKAKLPLVKQEEEATCTVTKVKLGRTNWSVEVEMKLPEGGPDFQSFQTWTAYNELYLVDSKARVRLTPTGSELNQTSSRKVIINYIFEGKNGQAPGKPEDLVLFYRAPASIVELPLRFQFKDVPLP